MGKRIDDYIFFTFCTFFTLPSLLYLLFFSFSFFFFFFFMFLYLFLALKRMSSCIKLPDLCCCIENLAALLSSVFCFHSRMLVVNKAIPLHGLSLSGRSASASSFFSPFLFLFSFWLFFFFSFVYVH